MERPLRRMRWKSYEVELKENDKAIQKDHKWSRAADRPARWSYPPELKNKKKFASMVKTHASVMNSHPKGSLWQACSDTGFPMEFQDGEIVIIEMSPNNWNSGMKVAWRHINGDPKFQTREERTLGNQTSETFTNLHGINDTLREDNAALNEAKTRLQAAFVLMVRIWRRNKVEREATIAEATIALIYWILFPFVDVVSLLGTSNTASGQPYRAANLSGVQPAWSVFSMSIGPSSAFWSQSISNLTIPHRSFSPPGFIILSYTSGNQLRQDNYW